MRNLLLLTLLISAMAVKAESLNNALLKKLTSAYQDSTLFEADFSQEKQVKFMSKPLLSEGRIRFAKGVGLQWIIKKPLYSLTRVNEKGIFKSNDYYDNKRVKDPQMQVVASLMKSLLSSQFETLTERFIVPETLTQQGNQWSVELQPKGVSLKKIIQKIELIGNRQLETENQTNLPGIQQFIIYDTRNNITRITFNNIEIQTEPLTAETVREF